MKISDAVAFLFIALWSRFTAGARVNPGVRRKLLQQGTVDILVTMKDSPKKVIESFQARESSFNSRAEKAKSLVAELETHAQVSQAEVTKLMALESSNALATEMRSFWMTNEVYFKDATIELVEKLSAMQSVQSISEDAVINSELPTLGQATNWTENHRSLASPPVGWGTYRIQAPSVWAQGYTGQGVVVGSFDTGVRGTHENLRGNWRREFGWFDPYNKSTVPYDATGHGTYTLGGIVGANGVGIAPGAKWIACKARNDAKEFTMSGIVACGEFLACPSDPSGTTKDCSKAPHVINYSFSFQNDPRFGQMMKTWKTLGIVPVVAMGNDGPVCGTVWSVVNTPDVISVGSTSNTDALSTWSSVGPNPDGTIKPDISAPGESITSSSMVSDTSYTTAGGTSIAAPIVTGTVALLLSKYPGLSMDEVRKAVTSTAETETLGATTAGCGGIKDGVFPNNMYGYGRVNAFRALEYKSKCGGLSQKKCEGAFFCSWNARQSHCQQWW